MRLAAWVTSDVIRLAVLGPLPYVCSHNPSTPCRRCVEQAGGLAASRDGRWIARLMAGRQHAGMGRPHRRAAAYPQCPAG
jgi:hypothetical protein